MNALRSFFSINNPGKPTRFRQLRAGLVFACLLGSVPVSIVGHQLASSLMLGGALFYMVVWGFLMQSAFRREKKEAIL